MKQSMLEDMGRDLCRTILLYENIYIPPELAHLFGGKQDGKAIDMNAVFA